MPAPRRTSTARGGGPRYSERPSRRRLRCFKPPTSARGCSAPQTTPGAARAPPRPPPRRSARRSGRAGRAHRGFSRRERRGAGGRRGVADPSRKRPPVPPAPALRPLHLIPARRRQELGREPAGVASQRPLASPLGQRRDAGGAVGAARSPSSARSRRRRRREQLPGPPAAAPPGPDYGRRRIRPAAARGGAAGRGAPALARLSKPVSPPPAAATTSRERSAGSAGCGIGDQPGRTHTEGGQSTILSERGGRWSPCTSGFKKRFLLRRRKRELGGKCILIGRKWGTENPEGRRVHHPSGKTAGAGDSARGRTLQR
ncbi:serine/arginine repetitive matrix protein 3-like [Aquila chrysaetos chrysaetos]|uniref:serine/arginine repetitive matrix protein 3-like n=1 Tax=Aquila chrysaetos chrysaetos TaxID=223781 RepID=UPI0011765625|nr:serine/arginine repetitive matrix protein 3-like [Aquila chrysaetos chrysaetos]